MPAISRSIPQYPSIAIDIGCLQDYNDTEQTFFAKASEGQAMEGQAMDPVVFHVDVNSAFLSWEAVYRLRHLGARLDLRTIPSAVGGDVAKRHGIILAKSIPAKAYGIQTGQSVPEALRLCPELYLVPPNYNLYQRSSAALIEVRRQYSPSVEQYSIDEAYLDMTGSEKLFGEPRRTADEIRERIRDTLGFTVNIGVGSNKLTAKMASEMRKPDRTHTLFPHELPDKLWPLPVRELFYVGRATERKLHAMGIHTIGQLARTDPAILRSHLHKHGEIIWSFANGIDVSQVLAEPEANKGYGNSTTIAFDVTDGHTAKQVLLALAETVAARLRADGVKIGVVAVSIRDYRLETWGHQITLDTATDITGEIWQASCRAFDEAWDGTAIRHLGIHTMKVSKEKNRQIGLFDQVDHEKLERLDRTIDAIRRRYGNDAVKRASFLEGRIDHMSGGVSRERRSVDYSRERID